MPDIKEVGRWTANFCDKAKAYNKVSLDYKKPVINLYNRTDYSTVDLRRIMSTAISEIGDITRVWYVTVGYRYKKEIDDCDGWAYIDTGRFHIDLPYKSKDLNMKELCQVIQHEIDHCLGLEHVEMVEWWDINPKWKRGLRKPRKVRF